MAGVRPSQRTCQNKKNCPRTPSHVYYWCFICLCTWPCTGKVVPAMRVESGPSFWKAEMKNQMPPVLPFIISFTFSSPHNWLGCTFPPQIFHLSFPSPFLDTVFMGTTHLHFLICLFNFLNLILLLGALQNHLWPQTAVGCLSYAPIWGEVADQMGGELVVGRICVFSQFSFLWLQAHKQNSCKHKQKWDFS